MRKILISILVCLLLIGSTFFVVNGMSKVKLNGLKGLDEENKKVEQKISDLSNIISVTYANTQSNLKRTANTLQDSKTEYENQAALSNSQSPSYASQLEKYDIDYLWTKIGNYAKSENVVIKIELVANGASKNLYNLNFTVTGEYAKITDFIYDIENDSKLGFKIDEFKMGASGDNKLSASFVCKEIPINVGTIDQASSSSQGDSSSNTTSDTTGTENATGGTSTSTGGNNTTTGTNSSSVTTSTNTSSSQASSTSTGTSSRGSTSDVSTYMETGSNSSH